MPIKHLSLRFLFLTLCLIPFGMLMLLGKPERPQGIIYDIENLIGLKNFTLFLFIFAAGLIGLEAVWLFVKKNKSKFLSSILLLIFFVPLAFYFSSEDVFYKKDKVTSTKVNYSTLLLATEGNFYNFNLDNFTLAWQYDSPLDSAENRNSFVIDGQNAYLPFESGGLKNFDINTGNVIWEQQIFGRKSSGITLSAGRKNIADEIKNRKPLFMSKPLVDKKNIVIASHGQPKTTQPFVYSFDKEIGKKVWQKRLPTHFNYFSPIKFKGSKFNYYFVNSAVYLGKFGANTGSRTSYGMFLTDKPNEKNRFKHPIYMQMQTDGKHLYIGDENGNFYSLPLDKKANVLNPDINDPNNTFSKNQANFKWIFNDETFTYPGGNMTYLDDGVLFTELKNGNTNQSALMAIDTANGKLKWKKVFNEKIVDWSLIDNEIIGNLDNKIFRIDASGEEYVELDIQNKPISNIEKIDSSNIVYLTEKGIEIYDINKKIARLVIKKNFNNKSHNNVQIKYIAK